MHGYNHSRYMCLAFMFSMSQALFMLFYVYYKQLISLVKLLKEDNIYLLKLL